jgi:4-amino-4-deoxy-L-arabinose transferase-like glycosyltransferase
MVLRLIDLDDGLWVDEIVTYANYAGASFGQLVSTYDSQNHHILYSLFAHASFLIFGESAWALRLPAVLFGVASIWMLYLFARQVATLREALLSIALLALSYHHVWFSQNARGYSALLFFTLLASWLLIRALRERRLHLWIGYAVAVTLGVYVHMTMLFVVFGQFIVYLWERLAGRREDRRDMWAEFLAGFCLAGLLTFVLYAPVLPQLLGGTYLEGVQTTIEAWTNPLWTLLELVRGLQIGFAGTALGLIAVLIFITGLARFTRTEPVVARLMIVPVLVTIAAIVALGHPMFPRTFFFAMGFGVLIVIRGMLTAGRLLARVIPPLSGRTDLPGTVLCLLLIGISALSVPRAWAPKQDFTRALEYVETHSAAGDAIVTTGVAAIPYQGFYRVDWQIVESLAELDAVRSAHSRTWLLYTMPLHMHAAYPAMMDSIEQDFRTAQVFHGTLGDGALYVVVAEQPSG